MKPSIRSFLVALALGGGAAAPAGAEGLTLREEVASGLDRVTAITHAGDGSGRLFIALQQGLILVRDSSGVKPTPFLDIRSAVTDGGEQGLLGLAFPPDHEVSRRFYVHYVDKTGKVTIRRGYASAADPDVAALDDGVLTVLQPTPVHKGGQLQFGPDGYLYVALGDGGAKQESQNLASLLGKILRIDVSGVGYSIPAGNPFVSTPGARPEIWAYGLRNPWRFAFDRVTGELFIADVGEHELEEVNLQPAGVGGRNYGWPRMEGSRCFDPAWGCEIPGLTFPIIEYPWQDGCSVTGGFPYRGTAFPGLVGMYLFADFCTGTVSAARPDGLGRWAYAPVSQPSYYISTLGEDEAGEIYVANYTDSGTVERLVPWPGVRRMSVGDARVLEGASGTRNAVFRVLMLPASASPVSVFYSTTAGSAVPGDYGSVSGTLTLPAGTTTATVTVPVSGDTAWEEDEWFSLRLGSASGAQVVESMRDGRGSIVNDDVGLLFRNASVAEGNPGAPTQAAFRVFRFGPLGPAVSVDFATVDETALAGSDYVATSGTLPLAAGQTEGSVQVSILPDILVEPSETFKLALQDPVGASFVGPSSVRGEIQNDDAGPAITANDVTVTEGDAGSVDAVFTVTLSFASEQTVTVKYITSGGTASAPADYAYAEDTLVYPPGTVTQSVTVSVHGDLLNEADEQFGFFLHGSTNGYVAKSGLATILDNDPEPTVSVGAVSVVEEDAGLPKARFPVTLSAPSGRLLSIPYATSAGTAQGGLPPVLSPSGGILYRNGNSHPYPWTINVPSFEGELRKVTVNLYFSVSNPLPPPFLESLDVLLVGPLGQTVMLMSDVPASVTPGYREIVLDDDGPALPSGPLLSGTYRPTDYGAAGPADTFDAPAPGGPYGDSLASLLGASPVGQWRIFARGDDPEQYYWTLGVTWRLELQSDRDYVTTDGAVVLWPGVTSAFAEVTLLPDQTLEPDETFGVDLGSPDHVTVVEGHAIGTILNDDQINLRVSDLTLAEGDAGSSPAVFTVRLDQPSPDTVTVDYATEDGTATEADGDYAGVTGTLTFPPGETATEVAVQVLGDRWHEADETFALVLSAPSGAEILRGRGVLSVPNDDPLPTLTVGDRLVTEGETAPFEVTLSAPSRVPVTVDFAVTGVAAQAGFDFQASAGVLTIPPLSLHETIPVVTVDDGRVEPSESFTVTLANPQEASIADGKANGWILDPAFLPRVQLSASQFNARESAPQAIISVRRTGDLSQAVRVDFRATAGSAHPGLDFTPVSGTLAFPRGAAVKTFAVPLLGDTLVDGAKTVLLDLGRLEGPVLPGAPETAVLTIADDDRAGNLRFGKPLFSAHEAGGQATISVVRSGGAASGVSIDYATEDDGATAGVDYLAASGTLVFGPRSTVQTFTVPLLADAQAEGLERVRLRLDHPAGGVALAEPWESSLAISDAQPTLEFASPNFTVKERSPRATVSVARSGPLTGTLTVAYATSDGTALQGVSYLPASGVLTFAPGMSSRTFSVEVLGDSLDQAAPTVLLSLSNPSGAVLGAQATAVLTLEDDDAPGSVQFGAASFQATRPAPSAVVSVARTGGAAQDVAIDYATTDGSATAGVDYSPASGTLHFGAGSTRQTFTVPLLEDGSPKGDETVALSLSNPSGGASLGMRSTAVLTIVGRDPVVQFSANAYRVAPGAASAIVNVVRSGPLTETASVEYTTADGSATAGQDYTAASGVLVFAPGERVRAFTVAILFDSVLEPDESVNLWLQNPGGTVALGPRSQAVLTLVTDDAVVEWGLSQITVAERGRVAVLTARRRGSLASPIEVPYSTSDGSAQAGADYTATTATLAFRAGQATQVARIPILDDAPDEPDETFQVVLGDPGPGVLLGPSSSSTVTIVDDDLGGQVELRATDWSVRGLAGSATITVSRNGGAAAGSSVDFSTVGGSALPGVHYEAVSGTLVFAAGERTKTFAVPILAAPSATGNVVVGLELSNPAGGASLGARRSGRLWVVKP